MKLRLSLLVVFSAVIGYLLASKGPVNLGMLLLFSLAGLLITAASNTINQLLEKDTDALMKRTSNRPLPTGVFTVQETMMIAATMAVLSLVIFIGFFNFRTALLAFSSLILYAFAYTPMKTRHPVAVFIGAIPGALPPMIGYIAVSNSFGWEPGILFAIQFVWQFPHFWAIAWVLDEDYKKAGIRLLPGSGQDIRTAFQIMMYTLFLIPLGFVPYWMGMTGLTSAIITMICGVLFLAQTFYLMKECSHKAARAIMFGSFLYLPVVQIALVLDKV
ncbi:MAG: heme o synthase [Cytophagaceae bacterium]|jgi:protoheme IX farnesyltransferase|nr:heme o synthase [Cytophagaceae bacterium]